MKCTGAARRTHECAGGCEDDELREGLGKVNRAFLAPLGKEILQGGAFSSVCTLRHLAVAYDAPQSFLKRPCTCWVLVSWRFSDPEGLILSAQEAGLACASWTK